MIFFQGPSWLLFGTEYAFKLALFVCVHLAWKVHDDLFHANLGSLFFAHTVWLFNTAKLAGVLKQAERAEAHTSSQLWLFKLTAAGFSSSSSHMVSPISVTFTETMRLLMGAFQSALNTAEQHIPLASRSEIPNSVAQVSHCFCLYCWGPLL